MRKGATTGITNRLTQSEILPSRELLNIKDWHPQDGNPGNAAPVPLRPGRHVSRPHFVKRPGYLFQTWRNLWERDGYSCERCPSGMPSLALRPHPNRGSRGNRVAIRPRLDLPITTLTSEKMGEVMYCFRWTALLFRPGAHRHHWAPRVFGQPGSVDPLSSRILPSFWQSSEVVLQG